MRDVRSLLRRALVANAAAVAVPAVVLVVFWMPDLVEMGLLGILLAALIIVPTAVIAVVDTFLARRLARFTRSTSVIAASVGVVQFVVAVIGVAEATYPVESACFVIIGSTALAVALAGVVVSLRSAAPDPLLPNQ